MSQAGTVNTAGGPSPPAVATSYTTQSGTAVPALNVLLIYGAASSANNTAGITTKGGVVGTGTSNEVDVVLTNRVSGSVSTVGATTGDILSFTPPATEGVYKLFIQVCAWISASKTGSTYEISGAVKSDGAGGISTIGTPVRIMNGESGTFDVNQVGVTVTGGAIVVQGTGTAGTVKWTGLLTYVFGGA